MVWGARKDREYDGTIKCTRENSHKDESKGQKYGGDLSCSLLCKLPGQLPRLSSNSGWDFFLVTSESEVVNTRVV